MNNQKPPPKQLMTIFNKKKNTDSSQCPVKTADAPKTSADLNIRFVGKKLNPY